MLGMMSTGHQSSEHLIFKQRHDLLLFKVEYHLKEM